MAWVITTARTRVHRLLNQDSSASNNLVTEAMIDDFLQEALLVTCRHGRAFEKVISATVTTSPTTFTTLVSGLTATQILEIFDVQLEGVSLEKVLTKDAGKTFQTGTANDVMWWYVFGDSLFISPTPTSVALTILAYCLDTTSISGAILIPDKYHDQLINFAVFRGKQVYNAHQEAATYLSAYASSLGINLRDLQERLGVSINAGQQA